MSRTYNWQEIAARHPGSGYDHDEGIDYAAHTLAHATDQDPEAEEGPGYMEYTLRSVPLSEMAEHHPNSESRVRSALQGYREGREIPPLVLVQRNGEYLHADGHHRTEALRRLRASHADAYVAESPHDSPFPDKDW